MIDRGAVRLMVLSRWSSEVRIGVRVLLLIIERPAAAFPFSVFFKSEEEEQEEEKEATACT